jgi:hypothetical protein
MSSKTLLLIYAIFMVLLSHCLYITLNYEYSITKFTPFVDCIFLIAETMTQIGFQDGF